MKSPPRPSDETRRLEELRQFDLRDPDLQASLDEVVMLAKQLCEMPMGFISFVEEQREWFESKVGFSAVEFPRDLSFGAHTILNSGLFLVPDATRDERFAEHPLVAGEPAVRSYAAMPLVTGAGFALGALGVMDYGPRVLTARQQDTLRVLARQVMTQLELRRAARNPAGDEAEVRKSFSTLQLFIDSVPHFIAFVDAEERYQLVNRNYEQWFKCPRAQLLGRTLQSIHRPATYAAMQPHVREVMAGRPVSYVHRLTGRDGELHDFEVRYVPRLAGDGAVTGYFVLALDVTERQQAEEALGLASRRLEFIAQMSATLLGSHTLAETAQRLAMQVKEVFEMDACVIRVLEDNQLRLLGAHGVPPEQLASSLPVFGLAEQILTSRQPVAIRDVREHPATREIANPAPSGFAFIAFAGVPLVAGGEIVGLLGIYLTQAPHTFTATDVAHLQIVAHHVAASLANERLFKTVQAQKRQLETAVAERQRAEAHARQLNRVYAVLTDINQLIVREKNPAAMLAAACRIAVEKGRFRLAWIGLVEVTEGRLEIAATAGAGTDTVKIFHHPESAAPPDSRCALTALAWRTGQHGICNDIATDPQAAAWRAAALERGYRAMASLPLLVGEGVIGVFNLYADTPGFFDADEIQLLDELARDLAFALEIHERETKRQRVEQALRDSEERFRELADNIQEVFWMTDTASREMLYLSPAFERIWGLKCADIYQTPRRWLEAIHAEDRAQVERALTARQDSGHYDETYRIQRPDGAVRWVHDRAFPIRDAAGKIRRLVGTAEDITEQRQLEEQFRHSQKMEAIGQLAGGVAHDFNNILAAMMMQLELALLGGQLPPAARENLEEMRLSTGRAASLTRQLLAFSRRQILQMRRLDLNAVVLNLTKMLQRILGEDVRLERMLDPEALPVQADAGMLDQVLLNLVVNARDAMPHGGRLRIETGRLPAPTATDDASRSAPPPHQIFLRVTDTGAGIEPEHRERIFEPFFTTKKVGQGTGIGLATVFGIVKQHGGTITVASEVGRGTTFQVVLPAAEPADEAAVSVIVKTPPSSGTETILLVEDEPAVRQLTGIILQNAGYRVLEAANGVEALRVWEANRSRIQLLFTDIVMPEGISGNELAARLLARNPKLKVILTSGYSADFAGRELSAQETRNFLPKPFAPAQMLETVRRCLDE